MESECIKYSEITFLNNLVQDYMDGKHNLKGLVQYPPDLKGFESAINNRDFSQKSRSVLVKSLKRQYNFLSNKERQVNLIDSLLQQNTFTVTTGHQLCLFTGPLYFIYKILSVIKLSEQLRQEFPEKNFVPVYWMASEDHDFLEINHFHVNAKKYEIPGENDRAVGKMMPAFSSIEEAMNNDFGPGKNAEELIKLFHEAYRHGSLSEATRFLVHQLLGKYGVVIIDPDESELKRLFISKIKRELLEQVAFTEVGNSIAELKRMGYKAQVNPREINLFYLQSDSRKRIVKLEKGFALSDNSLSWTNEEILDELDKNPENFSPNVLLRPVYQEVILPNLSYTGGAGELSYWFEMKGMFDTFKVDFPILLLRNSALITSSSFRRKLKNTRLKMPDLFGDVPQLEHSLVGTHSDKNLSLQNEQGRLSEIFEELKELAESVDFTLIQSTEAEKTKALKSLERLEKKLRRGEKRNNEIYIRQLHELLEVIFPNGSFQERYTNFSEIVLKNGLDFIDVLLKEFDPLDPNITVLNLDY